MPKRETIRPEKLKMVEELTRTIDNYPITGIIDLFKLPAAALQNMKVKLRGKASIKVSKKSILVHALQKSSKKQLLELLPEQPAILLTESDPFKLYKIIQKSKSSVAAKAGDVPTFDVEVKAGLTDLMPGPAISTLTKVGIPAKVEGGKIAVQRDKVVVKAGETITADMAAALQLLKMEPMEVGMNVVAIFEKGMIYKKDALEIDETKLLAEIMLASSQAFNLSMNSGYPTKITIPFMLQKAFMQAKQLGVDAGILDSGIIEELLAKAKLQADILSSQIKTEV